MHLLTLDNFTEKKGLEKQKKIFGNNSSFLELNETKFRDIKYNKRFKKIKK